MAVVVDNQPLLGQRVGIIGRLSGMSQRDAAQTIRRYGGIVVDSADGQLDLAVVGDDQCDVSVDGPSTNAEVLRESDLWHRLGLIDGADVRRLYTPAMLAELLSVPVAAIRRWHRRGALVATQCVRRLPYFDFPETAVTRKLVALLDAGCSLRMIDRRLAQLAALMPEVDRPLADPRVVVEGRRLFLRRGDDLAEPGGQLLLDFDAADDDTPHDDTPQEYAPHEPRATIAIGTAHKSPFGTASDDFLEHLHQEALDWEDAGELQRAADAYRSILAAGGPAPEINFALADVLYRQGDLTAARERLYAVIELDEEFVEARFSLGCVLAETGEYELAVAAFEGTLKFHADYADAHFHLARALEQLDRRDDATSHYTSFLALSPESPWATAARDALSEHSTATLRVVERRSS